MSEELVAENARLKARISELEALLAAKPPIDRESLYRATDRAPWGVLAINADLRLDHANRAAGRWLTRPPPATGERAAEALVPALFEVAEAHLLGALAGHEHEGEFQLRDAAGEVRELRLNILPRRGGPQGITGAVMSLYDVTETQALDRAVRENEARLTHIGAVTPNVNYIWDFEAGQPIWAAGRTEDVYGHSPEMMVEGGRDLARTLIHPEDLPKVAERLAELTARPDGHVAEFELRIRRPDGAFRWIMDRAVAFERSETGQVIKTLCTAIDIDERKRADERRILLINELNHRVKNTLAAVQSIARQTLRAGRPPEQTLELFTARLVALSGAHDVLTRENWEGAGLREIVAGALAPFGAQGEGRLEVSGPDVRLSARAALALAMALHELATNAAKYGALSSETGRVDLTWRIDPTTEASLLELEWRERGGPAVSTRRKAGFGSRLLIQGLPAELDGRADLTFAPEGLVWRLSAPLNAGPAPQAGVTTAPETA
ncbi:MAG: sensor histidine kinase [Pseudomonadota bacterium]